jgi:hypothetical protein
MFKGIFNNSNSNCIIGNNSSVVMGSGQNIMDISSLMKDSKETK